MSELKPCPFCNTSLRDYFAAKVLQSMLADKTFVGYMPKEYAKTSYEIANAMMEERSHD